MLSGGEWNVEDMNNDIKCGFPFLYPVPKQKKAFHCVSLVEHTKLQCWSL